MTEQTTSPKIVFFGTPEFAKYCLKAIHESGYAIAGVVTAPDKKAGRGKKWNQSAVKTYCLENNLPLLQPQNLKAEEFISTLKTSQADLFIVVAFRMLPQAVWALPRLGTFNLHASLLPNYRGAAPINWAIINGETKTGVSTFFINENIDTGAILLQQEVAIAPEDNVSQLHDKLLAVGAPLIIDTIEGIVHQTIIPQEQQWEGTLFEAPKLTPENTQLDWKLPLSSILQKIKGLAPYPGAWTWFDNNYQQGRMKILVAEIILGEHNNSIGQIVIEDRKILVACKQGYLNCKEVQLPNKKLLSAKELLNGYHFAANACVK